MPFPEKNKNISENISLRLLRRCPLNTRLARKLEKLADALGTANTRVSAKFQPRTTGQIFNLNDRYRSTRTCIPSLEKSSLQMPNSAVGDSVCMTDS